MADLMSAGPNGPCPYLGELSVTLSPSPRHWMQSVDVLPQVGVEHLLEVVD